VKAHHTLCFEREATLVYVYADRAPSRRIMSSANSTLTSMVPGQPAVVLEQAILASGSLVTVSGPIRLSTYIRPPTADGESSHQTFAKGIPAQHHHAEVTGFLTGQPSSGSGPAHQRDQQATSRVAPRSVKATTADGCRTPKSSHHRPDNPGTFKAPPSLNIGK
jgi:hypothetical protein